MATTTYRMTVEELERDGAPEGRWELIDGELVEMSPGSEDHGAYGAAIIAYLVEYALSHRLGRVYISGTGFVFSDDPPTVRVPDVAFVRYDRLPPDRDRTGFLRVMPDLAVEVVSPSDRGAEVAAKAVMWLDAGVRLLWPVDPDDQTVQVFAAGQRPRRLTVDDTLDGGDVLAGFTLPVAKIFDV